MSISELSEETLTADSQPQTRSRKARTEDIITKSFTVAVAAATSCSDS